MTGLGKQNSMDLREALIGIIHRAATSRSRVRTLLTPVGGAFFLLVILTLIIASIHVDKLLGFPQLLPTPLNIVVSAPIIAVGLFLWLWSALHFAKARGTPVPLNPPPRLVVSGPYRYARSPILIGVFIQLFGLGVLLRSVSLVAIFTPLFILLAVIELKAVEEPELERRLGDAYLEYRQSVPMFVPRLRLRTARRRR